MIDTTANSATLAERFARIRQTTLQLIEPLSPEDCQVQSMLEVSPTKWHLAHTTWFFETFVLEAAEREFRPFRREFRVLFNSYYEGVGEKHPRGKRGFLSRPPLREVLKYRRNVEERMQEVLAHGVLPSKLHPVVEIGLQHEQQRQELLLMDIQHVLATNPVGGAYRELKTCPPCPNVALHWRGFEEGLLEIGHQEEGFCFDNEEPRHRVWTERFELANRLVTAGEYLEFMEDGGYERPQLWLSDGWALAQEKGWRAPLYWEKVAGEWYRRGLFGQTKVRTDLPVAHISYFEADAFARWSGARLPTEFEWEKAAVTALAEDGDLLKRGNFLEDGYLQARGAHGKGLEQLFGDLWEWTSSPYGPYPGYRPAAGALGEYNGKFMANQMVLRGGCCASPREHLRASYRNFYAPSSRWLFGGLRLCRDSES
ncbi:MAG TPA: ergothioneine biosynthesis protein EgtB [Candidatus Krumholzibacteria bacterium]|nr:ergothioneine biosynthesis protein EgtB [Candidatus Krumholzibacteria bacterium]